MCDEYKQKYEAAIPSCCELQTFDEHADQVMICWGVAYAVDNNTPKTPCGECEYNMEWSGNLIGETR